MPDISINRRQVDHYGMRLEKVDHPRFAGLLVADVTIDNARSDLTINIDNGEVFNHRWNARGFDGTFKEFLIQSSDSFDYFKGKVARRTVFDAEATLEEMIRHLLEYRRDNTINAKEARRVWNILSGDDGIRCIVGLGTRSFDEFYREIDSNCMGDDDQEAMDRLWDHPGQWGCVMLYPNTIDVFFDLMWSELIKYLMEEGIND